MEKLGWRIMAIVFITLFFGLVILIAIGVYQINEDEKLTAECFYDVCMEYPEAYYENNICKCYSIDYENYEYNLEKTVYMDGTRWDK